MAHVSEIYVDLGQVAQSGYLAFFVPDLLAQPQRVAQPGASARGLSEPAVALGQAGQDVSFSPRIVQVPQ